VFVRDWDSWSQLSDYYKEWATYPPSWTSIKTQKWHWIGRDGVVAFSPVGSVLVVAGEPVGSGPKHEVMEQFLNWAQHLGFRCTGYYTTSEFQAPQIQKTFCGTASLVNLRDFTLKGKRREELRRALNQGLRSGLQVQLFQTSEEKERVRSQLVRAHNLWRKSKGPLKIGFFLSEEIGSPLVEDVEKWWVCWEKDSVAAYLTLLPYRSSTGETCYYVDHLIQNPTAHKFALDYLLARVLEHLSQEDVVQLSLGLNAFADCSLGLGTKGLLWGLSHLEFAYNSKGIRFFKNKFGVTVEEPRYIWRTKQLSAFASWQSIVRATFIHH
jgi:lysylphosphatidylglycerol synthetase-like protein (DUF2156 family)